MIQMKVSNFELKLVFLCILSGVYDQLNVICNFNSTSKEKFFLTINCFNFKTQKAEIFYSIPVITSDSITFKTSFNLNLKKLLPNEYYYLQVSCANFIHQTPQFKVVNKKELSEYESNLLNLYGKKKISIEKISRNKIQVGDPVKLYFKGQIPSFVSPISDCIIEIDNKILKSSQMSIFKLNNHEEHFCVEFESPLNFKKDTKIKFYSENNFICEYIDTYIELNNNDKKTNENPQYTLKQLENVNYYACKDKLEENQHKFIDLNMRTYKDQFGLTLLDWSLRYKNWKNAEFLFELGVNIHSRTLHLLLSTNPNILKEMKTENKKVYTFFIKSLCNLGIENIKKSE